MQAHGRARLHRRADRRHGHVEPLEGVPRRRWKNLGDAGFPDRILWHKAVAAKYPYYDITRVGIYGDFGRRAELARRRCCSIPEFYKVGGVERRLPRQPHGQDLVERAVDGLAARPALRRVVERRQRARLQGKLLLVVGELDTNVDPASTMQVVNALIKANKIFDLLVVPGEARCGSHEWPVEYGQRRIRFSSSGICRARTPDWQPHAEAADGRERAVVKRHVAVSVSF